LSREQAQGENAVKPILNKLSGGVLLAIAFGLSNSCASAQSPAPRAAPTAPAAAPAPVRTQMFDVPLEGLKGFDGIMYITDFLPGAAAARHSHPGYEFNYILKGAVTFQIDGQPPFTLTVGQGTYNVRDRIHAVRNASATEPAQLVAVLINDTGKPIAVAVP
jgi:quercetin dioxygenase-like cupin family protein